jgi:hypothetical protein
MTVPAHDAEPPTGAATGEALATLREAVAALPPAEQRDEHVDAAEHAARFEAVHEALVAVLADVDRT